MNMRKLKKRNFRKIKLGFMMKDLRKLIDDALFNTDAQMISETPPETREILSSLARTDLPEMMVREYPAGLENLYNSAMERRSAAKSLLKGRLMDNLEPGASSRANKEVAENLERRVKRELE